MFCSRCGSEVVDGARFCGECGQEMPNTASGPAGAARAEDGVARNHEAHAHVAAAPRRSFPRWAGVLIALLVALGIGAGLFFGMRDAGRSDSAQDAPMPVTMNIIAPNYNGDTDSKIKTNVSGTTKAGVQVNRTVFIAPSAPTFEIEPGTYTVEIAASPLLASGDFYAIPDPVELVVGDAAAGDADNAQQDDATDAAPAVEPQTIEFTVLPPDQVTQEQIDAARAAAIEGGFDEGKADELAGAIAEARDAAQFDPMEVYLPVLQAYKAAMESSQAPNDPFVNIEAWTARDWTERPLSYALVDIGDASKPVLAIAYKFDSAGNGSGTSGTMASYRIYDLYAIKDGTPQRIVDVTSLGYRHTVVFCQDGVVSETGSGGAYDGSQWYSKFDPATAELALIEKVTWSPDGFTYEDATGAVTSVDASYQRQVYDKYTVREDIEWHLVSEVAAAADSAAEAQPAEEPAPAAPEADLECPYYAITLPDDWGDAEISYHDGYQDDGGFGRGNYAAVMRGGRVVFEVWCFGANSGVQGDYSTVQIGTPSALADQGIHVDVIVPNRDASGTWDRDAAQAKASEYATYVTLH